MTPRQFARRLEKLADDVTREDLAEELGKKALELYEQDFRATVDPRGVGWAPRSRRSRRTNPLLDDTGRLKGGAQIVGVNKNGFGLVVDVPYAGYIHGGTTKMPRRRIVPVKGETLGTWAEPLQETARAFIRRKLEGK